MRIILATKIRDAVSDLCIQANLMLRPDVSRALKKSFQLETNRKAKDALNAIIRNAFIAKEERIAICQDTGLPVVFLEIGQEVKVRGDLLSAINKGVECGYKKGYLRNSIIEDPLLRGTPGYSPTVIHTDIVRGNKIRISVLPKGFGCENKTRLKMFKPTADLSEIKEFIIETVKLAGPDACPPYIVGVGVGGSADYAVFLAKKSLLAKISKPKTQNPAPRTHLQQELLQEINNLNIGPMGLGGKTTALAVNIETFPTHIAGLPVAVNISCHALRSATAVI